MAQIDLTEIQKRINASLPLANGQEQSSGRLTSENLPASHPIRELWCQFSEVYGHQWASQQGDEANDTWIAGLSDLSGDQYAAGFRALLARADTWPPNLIEFRQMCTGEDSQSWRTQCHKPYLPPERGLEDLTKKELNQKTGADTFAEIKGMF